MMDIITKMSQNNRILTVMSVKYKGNAIKSSVVFQDNYRNVVKLGNIVFWWRFSGLQMLTVLDNS